LIAVPYLLHAHNLYLETAIEQGLPGLAALLCLAYFAARALLRPRPGSAPAWAFRAAALASLVALLVHGMLDSQLFVSPLAPAIAHYRAALALDPANVTANRRLGQIELSRDEQQAAREHLGAAYAAAPGERATRQLLGESYAIAPDVDRAAALWRALDVSQG